MARPRLPRNVIALGLGSLFTDLSSEMIYPLLPAFPTVTLVVGGFLLSSGARPLMGLAAGWGHVLAVRFSDRIGKGIRSSPRDALIAASLPAGDRGRAFGLQRAMDHMGAAIGPGIAFLLLAGGGAGA